MAGPARLQCHGELMAIMLYTSRAKIQSLETSLHVHVHVYGRHTIKSFEEFLRLPDHGYKDYVYADAGLVAEYHRKQYMNKTV